MGLERWLVLVFLATLAVPVLLERLRRRRALPVELPAIRHLLREHARFQRVLALRRWLVLVLRIAAIGFLVLTFARPYLERHVRVGRGIGPDTAAVIVLDTSPLAGVNVEEEPLLAAERTLAEGFVRARAADALVAVTGLPPAGGVPHVVFEQDGALLLDHLAALDVVGEAEDPVRVLEAMRAALAAQPRANREVIWISARRLALPERRDDDTSGVRVVQVHPIPDDPPRGVMILDAVPEAGAVVSRVVNLSDEPFRGKLQVFGHGQRLLHAAELSLGAWEAASVPLPIPQGEAFLGSVRVRPATSLERYQVRYFAAGRPGQAARTFLVRVGAEEDPRRDPHFFLRSALRAVGEVSPRVASLADLERDPPRAGDWVFVAAEGTELPDLLPVLRGWLDAGSRVGLLLQSEPPPTFDLLGITLIGVSNGVYRGFTSSLPLSPELTACLADVTTRSLVLASESRAAGFDTLATTGNGLPLLLGRRTGAGYLAVDLAGLVPTRTDLPYHACFPGWIDALVTHVANATLAPVRTVFVEGDAFDAPPGLPAGLTSLADPEGRARTLDAGPVRLDTVGIHRVRIDDRGRIVTWELAVNPRADLDRAALEWPADASSADELTVPRRIDLSDLVLVLALLVLVPEVVVALRLTRRRGTRDPISSDS